uniref:Uncharacterized protein n=1 Tax=Candidatus Kentrum sp. FM TaxID=2126340 RepID=A0A450TR32_9GAMM|nr:MAG: hypothetical protein BECKFM1743C_GA0114222_105692 [Candidatus Kentron sp. FM]VFJ75416.1 MAG: hypothetical protein BECKFM1743A_GA0114220_108332 [Candidatus Kentron sp. FM]VFK23658.1 MAG: hypothetical protein BECKFM1743B_GA0114221_109382 [Candidatus Kentron sp. FM]
MPARKRPSSFAWFMVHVTFPLIPFLLEGAIRIIVFGDIDWTTFRSSTLAMSVGILCLFVNRSLIGHEEIIPSQEETGNMIAVIHSFSLLAICCFVFFGVAVSLSALMEKLELSSIEPIKHNFDVFILTGAFIPVFLSLWAQRSFNLRAVL